MWIIAIFFVILAFAQETYYCVQLSSSERPEGLRYLFLKVKDLPKVRIEKIQGLYTLRVGFYKEKSKAKELLKVVRARKFRDAFLRTCYYIPSRIILSNFKVVDVKEEKPEEEFYKLLVQSLLGGRKIKPALKVVEKALRYYPNSYYWWKLYGDLLLWNSKPQEALKAYLKAYELSPSKALAKQIFNIALSLNRLDIAKQFLEQSNAPPKVRIYVYESIGNIEELIKYLKKLKTKEALLILAEIYFHLGEKEKALKTLKLHDDLYGISLKSLLLKTSILFSQKRYEEALRALKEHFEEFREEPEYLRKLSDLAWMLGDYESAGKASEILISISKAQDVDYERLIYINAEKKPRKVIELSLKAYEKFKKNFFIEIAISIAFSKGYWDIIKKITDRYRELVFRNPYNFSAYIIALDKSGESEKAIKLVENYLSKRFNKEILKFYIYLLAEKKKYKKLKEVLRKYRKFEKNPDLALAFAYGYTVLQDGKRAFSVYNFSPEKDAVLYGDILYLLGKEEAARHYRFRTLQNMKEELRKNPKLLKNPEFLRTFLSLGIEFLSPGEFEKLLYKAKRILTKPAWTDIYLSYLLYKDHKSRVEWLARIYKYTLKPWMWLTIALENNDKPLIDKLIETEAENLPTRDRVEALRRLGEPYKALYYTFIGLESNPEDYRLYKQFRDLTVDWADRYEIETDYYRRKNLKEIRTKFKLKRRITSNKLFFTFLLFHDKPLEKSNLRKAPEGTRIGLGIEKVFDRGKIGLELGYLNVLKGNPQFSIYFSRLIRKKFLTELMFSKNAVSEETLFLYLGGMKDFLKISLSYPITNRVFGYFSGEYDIFRAQDETKLGKGFNVYSELSYKLRVGYPDYTFRSYINYGSYEERKNKGITREISIYNDFKALPENFLSFGIGFLFGYENKLSFVRVWRPFLTLDIGYNTRINGLFLGSSLGVGGTVFGQDNLSLGIDYSENRGGVKEDIFKFNLLYRRWY